MTKFKKIRRLPMDLTKDRGGHVTIIGSTPPVVDTHNAIAISTGISSAEMVREMSRVNDAMPKMADVMRNLSSLKEGQ